MAERRIKLFAWNILHGGGPKRVPEIALAVLGHAPDVVVLTEFRVARGGQIRAVLADHGLSHQMCTTTGARDNGILAAANSPIVARPDRWDRAAGKGRWLDCSLPRLGLNVSGVHIPDDSKAAEKAMYWKFLIRLARERAMENWVVLGDFNSGRHGADEPGATFTCTQLLGQFTTLGFLDAWRSLHPRSREASWVSHKGAGFRIDSAFLSPPLHKRLRTSYFSHAEREEKISDHSPLIVELESDSRSNTVDSIPQSADRRLTPPKQPGFVDSIWQPLKGS